MKINRISPDNSTFLKELSYIAKPPKKLSYIGTLPDSRPPTVAIVGTRKPTRYGKEVTEQFAHALATRGVVIVSGLALGVDGLAHKVCLEAGGTTIAVLGNGLPAIYPTTHRELAKRIVTSGGAILSEYDDHTEARGYQFLERNRLVSGLADAIIITEAAARSGTLNTAAHALEQGKDVFVVPGNITSPLSAGCNRLLYQGALPATSPDDVLERLSLLPETSADQSPLPLTETPLEANIVALLSSGVRDGDELLRQVDSDAATFNTTMTMLEIRGIIKALGANQWTRK